MLLLGQSPVAAETDSVPSAMAQQSVIAYPASFFAGMGLDTAYDMVRRVPGFVFDDGSAVRGFAGAAGNVLIDGRRPASKTDDLAALLARLPAGEVERIDLIRGGAPGIDMQGKTVVANVIRKRGSGFHGVFAIGAYKPLGEPFDPQVRVEGNWNTNGQTITASLLLARYHDESQADGTHLIVAPGGQLLDSSTMHNGEPNWQYLGTASYETPLLGGKFRVNLTLEDHPYNKFNIDNFKVAGHQAEFDRADIGDVELGEHYERDLVPDLGLELFGLEHLNKTDTISFFNTATEDQDFATDNHGGEFIGRAILHWRDSDDLTVDAGGEFAYNWLATHTLFSDNGVAIAVPAADVLVIERRGEIFTTGVWRPSATLAIEAGIRVEGSTISSSGDVVLSKTLAFPKPRLVATWTPDVSDQLRLRVEREVGQLDFTDFAANAALNSTGIVAGNPNLSPQRDWAFEAAYDRHIWSDAVVSLTVRHLLLQDVVDRVPVFAPSGVFDEPGNIGGGIENDIVGSFSIPLQHLGIDGAILRAVGTWRFSDVRDPTTGQKRPISLQHPLDAELHFSQDLPGWKLTWGVDSYYGVLVRDFRFDEIDSTYTGDEDALFVEYRPEPSLTLRLQTDLEQVFTSITRQEFSGPRDTSPLQATDFEKRRFGPVTFIRLRKTFS